MKFMETKNVATIVGGGMVLRRYDVKCYDNECYGVCINGDDRYGTFPTEEAATRYAIECADADAFFTLGEVAVIRR